MKRPTICVRLGKTRSSESPLNAPGQGRAVLYSGRLLRDVLTRTVPPHTALIDILIPDLRPFAVKQKISVGLHYKVERPVSQGCRHTLFGEVVQLCSHPDSAIAMAGEHVTCKPPIPSVRYNLSVLQHRYLAALYICLTTMRARLGYMFVRL